MFGDFLQNHVLTDEVLSTAITEVESLVNSRLSTDVSSDTNDLEDLTPNHFLIGRASPNLKSSLIRRYQAKRAGDKRKG